VLPIIRKYQRQLRAIRDLQRIIEETQNLESQWRDSPVAMRNKELLKRWKSQVKVRALSLVSCPKCDVCHRCVCSVLNYSNGLHLIFR